jgi:hypothetical protein
MTRLNEVTVMEAKSTLEMVARCPQRLLERVTRLSESDEHEDVRVFCGEELIFASYDSGRTVVVNPKTAQRDGLIDILRQAWKAATES